MSGTDSTRLHRITPTIDRHGYIEFDVVCEGDAASAACHQVCASGDCEDYFDVRREADGSWTHEAVEFDDDDDDQETTVRHPMTAWDECNVVNWLTADPGLIRELYDGKGATLRVDYITTSWEDAGGYSWRYADEAAS